MESKILELPLFDDFHAHFRDEFALKRTVLDHSNWAKRVLVMPNLNPPLLDLKSVLEYKNRVLTHIAKNSQLEPIFTIYLNEKIKEEDLKEAKNNNILALKWYPKGATTNSEFGIAKIENIFPILEKMEKYNLILSIHGEDNSVGIDIFEREKMFITKIFPEIKKRFPNLKIVLEHITTKIAVDFILSQKANLAATITPQHLLFNRNNLLSGGIKPHYYCLPILKREEDRIALLEAATSGDPRFFLGTDSAPHAQNKKENSCGCAGCYTAFHAPALYAQAFDSVNKIDKLKNFATKFGADFYGLESNNKIALKLSKQNWQIPQDLDYGSEKLIPLNAGENLNWRFEAVKSP